MSVLVTGASGFVGRHLVAELARRGYGVVAASRQPEPIHMRSPLVRWQRIDSLTQLAESPHLLGDNNVTAVVHLAAHVHVLDAAQRVAADDFRRVNVLDTAALAAAARGAGVRRFVFMSSVKVHGDVSGPVAFTEASPKSPCDAYGRSKWEAEQALGEFGAGLEVAVLRPPLVYGPGVGANFLRLMKLVALGAPLPLASVRNKRSLIYVENLVDATIACLSHAGAAGRVFLLSDDEDVSTPALLRAIGTALGKPARLLPMPPEWLRYGARLLGRTGLAERLLDSLVVNCTQIRQGIAWQPRFTLAEGMARTARWYVARG